MKLLERRRALMSILSKFIRFISGKPPLTLNACVDDKSTIDYKLYGESVQDGTPTPDAPVEVKSVGKLVTDETDVNYGKYKIPIKANNGKEEITTNIYLDEPLRKIGDYADYIDFENKVVRRKVGIHTFNGMEAIDIPSSIIEGYTPFRYGLLSTIGKQPFICNYLPFFPLNYYYAVSECLAKYSTGGQMFFVISNDRIPLNDTVAFKNWLTELNNSGNPLKVYYGLSSVEEEFFNLPNIPTFKGTTIYSIVTNIQPSNMEVTYYSTER